MDLSTHYLGLDLTSPLVPSASPLSRGLDTCRQLEDAGAGAIILWSLFEEALTAETETSARFLSEQHTGFAEAVRLPAQLPRLSARPGQLSGASAPAQGGPGDSGHRQPQRRDGGRLGRPCPRPGGGRRRRPGTQRLLRRRQPRGERRRSGGALPGPARRPAPSGQPAHQHEAVAQFQLRRATW